MSSIIYEGIFDELSEIEKINPMKKLIYIPFIAFFVLSLAGDVKGQGSLGVTALQGFPDLPADTAFEGQLYTFDIVLSNSATGVVQGPVAINMRIDSTVFILDTISNPVLGGSTIVKTYNNFSFTQPTFKTGNNIVVVWPSINNSTVPIDTFYTTVHFVPLLSSPVAELDNIDITAYPNPVSDYLMIGVPANTIIRRYQVFDTSGRLVMSEPFTGDLIDLHELDRGYYIVRLYADDREWRVRLLKQ
jgi:hypothetical protein